ncbi:MULTISPECIES: MarR family winged helix-turn-helix transcriptional regulator [unclassified Streptomyces]|uniref:MarR family winged helix-turn-helix transcriptional regulator n=2 Tax=Streptomyces TaxID=1883 RepID=UPI002B1CD020|nr:MULTISPECIES: MarR family winged helix-turn-helix transcriptional regulator [unclassified Streptomyces]
MQHYRILAALDEFGVAGQTELGRRCSMDRSDVVAAINELAEQGCVERTPDPVDRRRNRVTITTHATGPARSSSSMPTPRISSARAVVS